jgi:hypothetical protein
MKESIQNKGESFNSGKHYTIKEESYIIHTYLRGRR